jgi:DNA-binding NtrC family response regulator
MARLLVVDDDSDYAESFAEVLQDEGYDVQRACNGEEGLRSIHKAYPDAVLLDVDMPVMSGPDMAWEMLLRDCGAEEIPIILMSGNVDLIGIAARMGTEYFVAKPADLWGMMRLIDRVLKERRAPRWPPTPEHAHPRHE